MDTKTDFTMWASLMGFNKKQMVVAGKRVGMGPRAVRARFSGEYGLSETERMAMAAARAGLSPWTPETDAEAAWVARLLDLMRDRPK